MQQNKDRIMLDKAELYEILPHRGNMLLVDKIIELEPLHRAVGEKKIDGNETFLDGHFPGYPLMPGVLITEAMAQVGAVAVLYPDVNRGKILVLTKITEAVYRKPVVPGDVLQTEAVVVRVNGRGGVVRCSGWVRGITVSDCEMHFVLISREEMIRKTDSTTGV